MSMVALLAAELVKISVPGDGALVGPAGTGNNRAVRVPGRMRTGQAVAGPWLRADTVR
jgi:hypothetical protein